MRESENPMVAQPERLDSLVSEDPIALNLLRIMRDGAGASLDVAVKATLELGVPEQHVLAAAEKIREQSRRTKLARVPSAVIAGGIESWYPGARAADRSWGALERTLRADNWDDMAIESLDVASNKVVAQLPDPHSPGASRCCGLVIGYVQSGKTTNFTAVIAKAADAGYRLFIVLSGMHNGLRLQTQERLNEQLWEQDREHWNRLTDEDDFVPTANVDALISSTDMKTIAIVKKHGQRLRALRSWLFEANEETLAKCPVLIIDDEADQASINTAKPDQSPSVVSGLIKSIVNDLPKSAYVGYSATPFANVLIDPANYEDLYPRDFIVDLPRPSGYLGPEAIFGREPLEFDENRSFESEHDFIREVDVDELSALRPKGTKAKAGFEMSVTKSLEEALQYFLLSTAARRVRQTGPVHSTALIHTSQYTDVHAKAAREVRICLDRMGTRLVNSDAALIAELETTWIRECELLPAEEFGNTPVTFDDLKVHLAAVAADVRVIVDNSRSEDRLDFDDREPQVTVAVGGNTLSRGLTLEGLCVSYFVRSASAYDTLLQMGRWFGFRRGYEDLMRIWMTDDMREWFAHLATVEQEIRYDIARYTEEHITPEEVGPRLRTHPKLAITAAAKMRGAVRANMSYSGRRLQTILFEHRDPDWLEANRLAVKSLVEDAPPQMRRVIRGGVQALGKVSVERVIRFLDDYSFHPNARDLDSALIAQYLEGRLDAQELTHFSVVIMGRDGISPTLGSVDLGLASEIGCINRSKLKKIGGTDYADIKGLVSTTDRVIDLDITTNDVSAGTLAALRNSPTRGGQGDGSGLLAIYPISKDSVVLKGDPDTRVPLDAVAHVMGLGIVFPETASADAKVKYMTADVSKMGDLEVEIPDDADDE